MASTRNRNTPGDYELEQRRFADKTEYLLDRTFATPPQSNLPGHGLLPSRLPREMLTPRLPTTTESFLFGIGATNLYRPAQSNNQTDFHTNPVTLSSLNVAPNTADKRHLATTATVDESTVASQRPYMSPKVL